MAWKKITIVGWGAFTLLLSGCGADWERQTSTKSPDGKLQAVVEYNGSAACCSDHSRLRLLELAKGTLREEDPGIIVEVTRANLRPHWEGDDRLIVEACGATNYEVTARLYRKKITLSDGSENAVRIDVISIPNTSRNGTAYCAASGSAE
jgi:hypothetical protein